MKVYHKTTTFYRKQDTLEETHYTTMDITISPGTCALSATFLFFAFVATDSYDRIDRILQQGDLTGRRGDADLRSVIENLRWLSISGVMWLLFFILAILSLVLDQIMEPSSYLK